MICLIFQGCSRRLLLRSSAASLKPGDIQACFSMHALTDIPESFFSYMKTQDGKTSSESVGALEKP